MTPLLDRRPIVIAVAGPNGAGKSTYFEAHLARTGLPFVNADVLALRLSMDAYAAAKTADVIRRQLVEQRESFIFETVFSDPVGDKLAFLKEASNGGYAVLLIFIGLADAMLSEERVLMRASKGGHDVPNNKLMERYARTIKNLKRALKEVANVWVYDHSDLVAGYRLVATVEDGGGVRLHGATPEWLMPLLP